MLGMDVSGAQQGRTGRCVAGGYEWGWAWGAVACAGCVRWCQGGLARCVQRARRGVCSRCGCAAGGCIAAATFTLAWGSLGLSGCWGGVGREPVSQGWSGCAPDASGLCRTPRCLVRAASALRQGDYILIVPCHVLQDLARRTARARDREQVAATSGGAGAGAGPGAAAHAAGGAGSGRTSGGGGGGGA